MVHNQFANPQQRLSDLYPLFLRRIRNLSINRLESVIKKGTEREHADVVAQRCEVTIGSADDKNNSHEYFWLFSSAGNSKWSVALRCNSDGLIRDDEAFARNSVFKYGAYSFFSLATHMGVNWPLRLHLHINLPTTVDRRDWRSTELDNAKEYSRNAARAMCEWLEVNSACCDEDWSIDRLFPMAIIEGTIPDAIFQELKAQAARRKLLVDLWGQRLTSLEAKNISLYPSKKFREAWKVVGKVITCEERLPLVISSAGESLVEESINPKDLCDWLSRCAKHYSIADQVFAVGMFEAVCGVDALLRSRFIEQVFSSISVKRANGKHTTILELFEQRGGADLEPAWHQCFGSLLNAYTSGVNPLPSVYVSGSSLQDIFRRFSTRTLDVRWDEFLDTFSNANQWRIHGELFWKQPHAVCPDNLAKEVIENLCLCDNGHWVPVVERWLIDKNANLNCLRGVVDLVGGAANNQRLREECLRKIDQWGLFRAYEDALANRISSQLPRALLGRMREVHSPNVMLDAAYVGSKRSLGDRWQFVIKNAERESHQNFVDSECLGKNTTYIVVDAKNMTFAFAKVLSWLPDHQIAPDWLDNRVVDLLQDHGVLGSGGLKVLIGTPWNRSVKTELGKRLLDNYWLWKGNELSPKQSDALDDLLQGISSQTDLHYGGGNRKRLEEFIIPASEASLFAILMGDNIQFPNHRTLEGALLDAKSVTSKCLSANALIAYCEIHKSIPIGADSVHEDIRDSSIFSQLYRMHPDASFLYSEHIDLVWKLNDGKKEICRKSNVDVGYDEASKTIYVNKRKEYDANLKSQIEEDYHQLLGCYVKHSGDASVKAEMSRSKDYEHIYSKYAKRILEAYRKEIINDGYEHRHIFRELLQNAESAYATSSKSQLYESGSRYFRFSVKTESSPETARAWITHIGRGFDYNDIERIVSRDRDAFKHESRDQIGRFNRGFRSVFNVTNQVAISSNGYEFKIGEFLRRNPVNPLQDLEKRSEVTEFVFDCSSADVRRMFDLRGEKLRQHIVSHDMLLFLRHIDRIAIDLVLGNDVLHQEWTIERTDLDIAGWQIVRISDRFVSRDYLVYHGTDSRVEDEYNRFAVGVQIEDTSPVGINKTSFYMTFPTATPFNCGFVISGDFEAESGRRSVLTNDNKRNAQLACSPVEALLLYCNKQLEIGFTIDEWVAWAKIWNLRQLSDELKQFNGLPPSSIDRLVSHIRDSFLRSIPDGKGGANALDSYVIPSRLMRAFADIYGAEYSIDTDEWIPVEVAAVVEIWQARDTKGRVGSYKMTDYIDGLNENQKSRLLSILLDQDSRFGLTRNSSVEEDEAADAARLLEMSSVGVIFVPTPPSELLAYWAACDVSKVSQYTLDGDWAPFLIGHGCDGSPRDSIKHLLINGDNLTWFKILGIACLISSGRRVGEIQNFWKDELERVEFWQNTSTQSFDAVIQSTFADNILKVFNDQNASGENADLWRRVFYDFRKVHHLVYQHQLPQTILELAVNPDAGNLIDFLRSGQLRSQERWRGVLGQSTGSSIFFIMRELCRLGVIPQTEEVKELSFFVCNPVRRAAIQFGLIDQKYGKRYDFAALKEISADIYNSYKRRGLDAELGEYYDIPLLHYAKEHRRDMF